MSPKINVLPKVGETAPEFTLPDEKGNLIKLSQFLGRKVVLYFYPKDDTPGCTQEACSFRDELAQYEAINAVVLGVSLDDERSHQAFMKKYDLNFTLLADKNGDVTRLYCVMRGWGPLRFAKRATFVIDSQGVIRAVFPSVRVSGHSEEVLKVLKEIE